MAGGSVGPLFRAIMVDQFIRSRDGDRFWYQNSFSGTQLYYLEQTSLAKIIKRNTELTNIQPNVFFARRGSSGGIPIPPAPGIRPATVTPSGVDNASVRPTVVSWRGSQESQTMSEAQVSDLPQTSARTLQSRAHHVKRVEQTLPGLEINEAL